MKKLFYIISLLIISGLAHAEKPSQIEWLDLIPESQRQAYIDKNNQNIIDHNGPAAEQSTFAEVRRDLDGQHIMIPGFVIPLEGSEMSITEFLLVPYFGACIHVPPPPSNQIIYVKSDQGIPMTKLWDLVYVTGELSIESVSTDLAEVGYLLKATTVSEYQE